MQSGENADSDPGVWGGPGTRVSCKLPGEVSTTAGPQAALISKGMSYSGIHI